jgi:DNA polymerase III subunit beta
MNLYIERDQLIRGLQRVQGIVERRTTNISLAHVLLSAENTEGSDTGSVRMTATDTMVALVASYPARVEKTGELSVDAQAFFQIARALPEPSVHLVADHTNRLQISSGKSVFNIVGMGPEDFPPLPSRDEKSMLKVSGKDLRRLIEETHFSVSGDDNRYGLNGAHLEEVSGSNGSPRVRVVTTDGSRLSWSETGYEGKFGMGRRMLLPRKVLGEVKKLVESDDASWDIAFGERSAQFHTEGSGEGAKDGVDLMVRLVDGEFPDYRQVLPSAFKRSIQLRTDRFADALRRVAIVATDRNHSVRFAFQEDGLVLSASNVDMGDAREEVPAEVQGQPLVTGFNVKYFQDILGATKSDRIQLEMGDALDPCIVRIPDRDDCEFVVMPMRME